MDFETICRLCLENKSNLQPIHQKHLQGTLADLLEEIVRIQVYSNDGLPQQVCEECSDDMREVQKTIRRVQENDLELRRQLNDTQKHVPLVDIKEEEIELEMLNSSSQQDLFVKEINKTELKEESDASEEMHEEYLNEEELEQSDEEYEEIVKVSKRGRRAKPRKVVQKRKTRKRRQVKCETPDNSDESPEPKTKRKPGRKRTRLLFHDRPRRTDHKCYMCNGEQMESAEALVAHLNDHRDLIPYTCNQCVMEKVVLIDTTAINNHLLMHRKPYKCPHCDRHYSDTNSLDLHMQKIHPEETGKHEPHFCEVCGVEFPTKLVLQHHLRTHTYVFSCQYCGKMFKGKRHLNRHISSVHEPTEPQHECMLCHKKLKRLDALRSHMRTMHSEQEFQCRFCSKKFNSINYVRLHEKRHENGKYQPAQRWTEYYDEVLDPGKPKPKNPGDRRFKCRLCNAVIKQVGSHMRNAHFPEQHSCEKCGDVFRNRKLLQIHVLEHEQGPAHQCPICAKQFSLKKNLIVHLRTKMHAGHPLTESLDWLVGQPRGSGSRLRTESSDKSKIEMDTVIDFSQAEECLVHETEQHGECFD
ncbi:zinc finger protein draculin-like [Uranotaenia lowii]|uniref:zinc finger protein draculin-like n=1 Tax=Uranotaenia lowii TaxID=190385 RepID=UPI00247A6648|nr:zinc finger protein draculin-like [Uranotaenia lowii]XP_055613784.1 zinc finger protein draculin-like [Uranotaenia lowii]